MKKKTTTWWVISLVVLAVVLIGVSHYLKQSPTQGDASAVISTDSSTTPTALMLNENGAPWPVELMNLKARLEAHNLSLMSMEGSALHIHQHLDIYIHGQKETVPAGIGIIPSPELYSPIHVHDLTGIIHVESPVVQQFTLGEFFDVWGVRFTSTCLGGYCTSDANTLRAYVNGRPYEGDLRALPLTSHEEITLTFGTKSEEPKDIPSSFTFPAGY